MKYFLCGLIILGLIAISGCAARYQYDEPANYDQYDELVRLQNSMEQDINRSLIFWSLESDTTSIAGNVTFYSSLTTLVEIIELQIYFDDTAEEVFKGILRDELDEYVDDQEQLDRIKKRAISFMSGLTNFLERSKR